MCKYNPFSTQILKELVHSKCEKIVKLTNISYWPILRKKTESRKKMQQNLMNDEKEEMRSNGFN